MHLVLVLKLTARLRCGLPPTALALAISSVSGISIAQAATPAEVFISGNIQKSLDILNDKKLSIAQRNGQFEEFLLSVSDMKRIAMFTLGTHRRTASQTDQDVFATAFQNYAISVYQSYFAKYADQTLKITGSSQRAPGDFIVTTSLVDPHDHGGQQALEIDFRVRTDMGKPVLVDFSVAGIWLALEERDQFSAFLNQNDGNIRSLALHLDDLRTKLSATQ